MATDVPLRCACGTVRGEALGVSPDSGCRIVCYCDDCQAFARFLGRAGITDQWGGTDIFQMPPSRIRITAGTEAISCVRLSPKGMHRWYCGRCMTPVGNTINARWPFVGVVHQFMDHAGHGRSRDEVLGTPLAHVQTKFAVGDPPIQTRGLTLLRFIARTAKLLGKWFVTGAASPSPFFDDKTRVPRATPRVLRPEERRVLA